MCWSSERKNTVGSFSTKEHHNRGLSFPGSISTYIDWSTQDNNVNPVDLEAWSCAGLSPIATANTANGSDDVIMKTLPVRLSHYFTESQHVSGDLSPCSEWCSLMLGIRLDHYTERNSSSVLGKWWCRSNCTAELVAWCKASIKPVFDYRSLLEGYHIKWPLKIIKIRPLEYHR